MGLTPRWFQLKHVPVLATLMAEPAKYNVIHAGRRAYKTESRKRRMVKTCGKSLVNPVFAGRPFRGLIGAPTRQQVKDIYWADIKAMVPTSWTGRGGNISEVELSIRTTWGALIQLVGMDKPQRAEGGEWDYAILDEYGDMKPDVWGEHLMPMLTERMGWGDFVGVPEGRNHYYNLHLKGVDPSFPKWASWGWSSGEVQAAEWVGERKANMDPLTAAQEMDGDFVSWTGRAYHQFDPELHCRECAYDPAASLILCFDFNLAPGVCAICQEAEIGTTVIGEIWIPQGSNTIRVCEQIISDWGTHSGPVIAYGDATGGARGTARVRGSDWDLIRETLKTRWPDLICRVKKANPAIRSRVNAVNTRLHNSAGESRLFIDGSKAPHVAKDLDAVKNTDHGQPNENDGDIGHISAALGYYIDYAFPISNIILKPTGRVYVGGGAGVA